VARKQDTVVSFAVHAALALFKAGDTAAASVFDALLSEHSPGKMVYSPFAGARGIAEIYCAGKLANFIADCNTPQ